MFAPKQRQILSIIPGRQTAPESANFNFQPTATEPAEPRLRVVEPRTKRPRLSAAELRRKLALVSSVEVMRVNRATIREGLSHCVWPPDVVEKISSADVITESVASHYVVREGNLIRVK